MTIIDEACYERGCACHDSREGSGIEVFAGDGGYSIGTREAYEEFVKLRNYPIPPQSESLQNEAQRTWVGLTEEDKQIAFDDTQEGGGFWEFADAIEAKLKEKNT